MTLFPKHRPHPEIANPFAFRYFLEFLRRNWLVWIVLGGGVVWFYIWVGAEAWRLIRANLEVPEVAVVQHAVPLLPKSNGYVSGSVHQVGNRPLILIEEFPETGSAINSLSFWIMDLKTGEIITSMEFIASRNRGFPIILTVAEKGDSSLLVTVGSTSNPLERKLRLGLSLRERQALFIHHLVFHFIVGDPWLTTLYQLDLETREFAEVAQFEAAFFLEGFLPESGRAYGSVNLGYEKDIVALTNASLDELEQIPIYGFIEAVGEDGDLLIKSEDYMFAYNEISEKARIIPKVEHPHRYRIFGSYDSRNTKWNLEIDSLSLKDPQTGQYKEARFLCPTQEESFTMLGAESFEFDESAFFMDPFTMQAPPAKPRTPDIRDYHTSSTTLMMFVGDDHLLRATEDGWKLEHLDDFLKAHPPRQIDLNQFR